MAQSVKTLPALQTWVSIPGSGGFPGEGNGKPFQYSCLGNTTDSGAWWAMVVGLQEWTRLSVGLNHCHHHTGSRRLTMELAFSGHLPASHSSSFSLYILTTKVFNPKVLKTHILSPVYQQGN